MGSLEQSETDILGLSWTTIAKGGFLEVDWTKEGVYFAFFEPNPIFGLEAIG